MTVLPGNYIAIAFDPTYTVLPDPIAGKVNTIGCDETKGARLKQMIRGDGRKMPGKATVLVGSELEIVEPEFVVWDADQQQYPFVFNAIVGTWGVVVETTPPEGFVADFDLLYNAVLDGTVEAAQFVITEVGSDLVPMQTKYTVAHNGELRIIRSHVDIRLTAEYARQRGFDVDDLVLRGLIVDPPKKEGRMSKRVADR